MPTLVLVLIAMALLALGSLVTLALTFPRRGRVRAAQFNLGRAYWRAMGLQRAFGSFSGPHTTRVLLTEDQQRQDAEDYRSLLRDLLDSWRILTGRTFEPPKPEPETITNRAGFRLVILALFMLTLPGCLLTPSEMGIGLVIVVLLLGALWALLNRWYKKYDQD